MFYVCAIYTRPLSAQAQYSRSCQNICSFRYNSSLDTWTVVRLTGGTTVPPCSWEIQIREPVSPVVGVPDDATIHGIGPCEALTCAWLHCKPRTRPPIREGAAHEQGRQQLSLQETQNHVICHKLVPTARPALRPTVGGNATRTQTRESQ
jgi:hypothetical protein